MHRGITTGEQRRIAYQIMPLYRTLKRRLMQLGEWQHMSSECTMGGFGPLAQSTPADICLSMCAICWAKLQAAVLVSSDRYWQQVTPGLCVDAPVTSLAAEHRRASGRD